jgi:hypothetical protein
MMALDKKLEATDVHEREERYGGIGHQKHKED